MILTIGILENVKLICIQKLKSWTKIQINLNQPKIDSTIPRIKACQIIIILKSYKIYISLAKSNQY